MLILAGNKHDPTLDYHKIHFIVAFLKEKINPWLIILFGSATREQLKKDSDIDIAFLSTKPSDPYNTFIFSQELASLLNRDIDLVNLALSSTVFQTQVITSGKVIYCADESRRMYYFMLTLKKYAKLNEERKVIFASWERKGAL